MNIYQKLAAITVELNTVAKNLCVGEGKNAYKAVGEADVLSAVKPLESKYGVYSYPLSRQIVDREILTSTKVYNGQETTTTKLFMRVETIYRFINVEQPEEYVDITTYGDGIDSGDKAPGKAMTYGDKYALLKAYKIITGDDPDQAASEETGMAPGNERRFPVGTGAVCMACGKEIRDAKNSRGEIWKAKDIATYTKLKFNKQLCVACMSAEKQ